jgi:hypothetical protein
MRTLTALFISAVLAAAADPSEGVKEAEKIWATATVAGDESSVY